MLIKKKAKSYINQGAYDAIGEITNNIIKDENEMTPYQRETLSIQRSNQAMQKEQYDIQTKGMELPNGNRLVIDKYGNQITTSPEGKVINVKTRSSLNTSSSSKKQLVNNQNYNTLRTFISPDTEGVNSIPPIMFDYNKKFRKSRKGIWGYIKKTL